MQSLDFVCRARGRVMLVNVASTIGGSLKALRLEWR
jgi:hypothetical protein